MQGYQSHLSGLSYPYGHNPGEIYNMNDEGYDPRVKFDFQFYRDNISKRLYYSIGGAFDRTKLITK